MHLCLEHVSPIHSLFQEIPAQVQVQKQAPNLAFDFLFFAWCGWYKAARK